MSKTTVRINPVLLDPITDLESAMAWIRNLQDQGLMFHFEDNPSEIPCFNAAEAVVVRQQVAALYALDWKPIGCGCPIGYALSIMPGNE